MADLQDVADIALWWGSDLQLSPTGDLATVIQVDRSRQRVLRRLMTNQGDYLFEPTYGAGVPGFIGADENDAAITATIRGQMQLEDSVSQSPEPTVSVSQIANGVSAAINYIVAPEQVPASLSFTATP